MCMLIASHVNITLVAIETKGSTVPYTLSQNADWLRRSGSLAHTRARTFCAVYVMHVMAEATVIT